MSEKLSAMKLVVLDMSHGATAGSWLDGECSLKSFDDPSIAQRALVASPLKRIEMKFDVVFEDSKTSVRSRTGILPVRGESGDLQPFELVLVEMKEFYF